MKITVEERKEYSAIPHVIIQCQNENEEVREIVKLLQMKEKKVIGMLEQKECIISPEKILYCESVDGTTFVYTSEQVYRTMYTLSELEEVYQALGYFRCSKSVVLNIHAIETLKSEFGNRIDACLINGEHIIISRRYAKTLRAILKGGEEE